MKRLISLSLAVLLGFAFVIPITPLWAAGSLTVISPSKGDTWIRGKSYTIKWSGGSGSHVYIELNGTRLSDKTENDGEFEYTVPSNASVSNYKRLYIESFTNNIFCTKYPGYENWSLHKAIYVYCTKGANSNSRDCFGNHSRSAVEGYSSAEEAKDKTYGKCLRSSLKFLKI